MIWVIVLIMAFFIQDDRIRFVYFVISLIAFIVLLIHHRRYSFQKWIGLFLIGILLAYAFLF